MYNSTKTPALTSGISLIIMAIGAGFAYGWVHQSLVTVSAVNTFENLAQNQALFLGGIIAWGLIFITDLIVSVALYILYQSAHKKAAGAMAILRIVYTALLGLAILQLVKVYPLIRDTGSFSPADEVQMVARLVAQFEMIWSAGLIVFGMHLAALGYAALKSAFTPRIFSYLLYVAGFSYTLIHGMYRFAQADPNLVQTLEQVLTLPMALGEMLFAGWLIYFGYKKRAVKIAAASTSNT